MSGDQKVWYLVVDNKADGPYSEDDLRAKVKNGEIGFSDLVFRAGLDKWTPINELKEFDRRGEGAWEHTAAEFDVPVDNSTEGWILLVKRQLKEGKSHYIQSGPYTTEQVSDKINKGEVKHEDHAWQKGFTAWRPLASLDEFDRRRPKNLMNTTPKPEVSKKTLEPETIPEFEKEVFPKPEKAAPIGSYVLPSTAPRTLPSLKEPSVTGATPFDESKFVNRAKERVPIPNLNDDVITDVIAHTRRQNRATAIAIGGAVLGMALALVGMNAYKQTLKDAAKGFLGEAPREIAVAPSPIPIKAVKTAAKVLNITGLKLTTSEPQLVFETDLPGGSIIDMTMTAEPGNILRYPTFLLNRRITTIDGQLPSYDLGVHRLPAGDYQVALKSGALSAKSTVAIGNHDREFRRLLGEFRRQITIQREKESTQIEEALTFANRTLSGFEKDFKKAQSLPPNEARIKWNEMMKNWKKAYERHSQNFKDVSENTRNKYVYPEFLMEFNGYLKTLQEVTGFYDRTLRSGRKIASEEVLTPGLRQNLADFKDKWDSSKNQKADSN